MKWKFVVRRNLSLLFYELINKGQGKKPMKKFLGVDFGFDNHRVIDYKVYYASSEIDEASRAVKEGYLKQGPKFFELLLAKWSSFLENLEKLSMKISKKKYSKKTNQELIKEFEKLKNSYYKSATALMAPILIEDVANEVIKKYLAVIKPNKVEEYFNVLTASERESEGTKELKSMLKIAAKLKKKENISTDIKKHIKEFGWINTRGLAGDPWSEEEIRERLNFLLDKPEERLQKLKKHSEEIKAKTKEILDEIKADDSLRHFVEVVKEYVFFRTYRMDIYVKSGFLARPLFQEIAKKINLDLQDIFYLLSDEIINALKHDKDFSAEAKKRRKEYGFFRREGKISVLIGKGLEEYKEKYMQEKIKKDVKEIKGTMASPGNVEGIVKVLAGKEEINKIEKGDILVTSMTTPDFVPAMEKAAAFVTDEGGILCHAAIVSREMDKPCIIGTKIATKVLKDGDIVEVKADEGTVKIIRKE